MNGRAAARGVLLLAFGLALASAAAADEAQPFHRWGLGWGDMLTSSYGGGTGVALRYRLPSGWSFTAIGSFSDTSTLDYGHDTGYYYGADYEKQGSSDPVSRAFGVECAWSFRLHPRLALAPVLRAAHAYSRRVEEDESLRVYTDDYDWSFEESRSRTRSETYRIGLGLRPQLRLHERVTVEGGFFLDYWRSHESTWYWSRETSADDEVEVSERWGKEKGHGVSWSLPTPSMTMGVLLIFYF